MNIAELVTQARKRRGLTKKALADKVGVHPSTITRLEHGEIVSLSDTIAKITDALGLDPSEVQAAFAEKGKQADVQYVNLSRVHPDQRARLRRAIEALVREWEDDEDGEGGGDG